MSEGTMRRTIRCEEGLWQAALTKARTNGVDLSSVIRSGLSEYVDGPAKPEPVQPAKLTITPKIGKRITVLPYRDCYPVTVAGNLLGHVKEVSNDVWRGLPIDGSRPVLGLTRGETAHRLANRDPEQ